MLKATQSTEAVVVAVQYQLESSEYQFSSVQSLSRVWLFGTPWTAACQASLSFTISHCLLRHWVSDTIQPSQPLSHPSPLALSLSQHQGLFQWVSSSHQMPKYWSFSFSSSPSNEYLGLISFRIDWFDLLTIQGTLKSLLQCSMLISLGKAECGADKEVWMYYWGKNAVWYSVTKYLLWISLRFWNGQGTTALWEQLTWSSTLSSSICAHMGQATPDPGHLHMLFRLKRMLCIFRHLCCSPPQQLRSFAHLSN